uniref:N-alpha-acetyltransferase 40 n=1 Tax=Amorphochlora amoebiformis TaxID=1561963 RepID=A0A7S0GYV5_9EUKA
MQREVAGKERVKTALEIKDIFQKFTAFKTFKKLGLVSKYKHSEELSKEEKLWVFDLLERNMKTHYQGTKTVGWDAKNKKMELSHEGARFIVVYDEVKDEESKENNSANAELKPVPIAYVMWRFLMDDDGYGEMIPELYLWEIHIEETYRRKGLGKYLMSISELAAWTLQMKKICLTAFTSNPASLKFFQDKMKYKVDATDPGLCEPDEPPCGYRILSKIRA